MHEPFVIRYEFAWSDGTKRSFLVELDPTTLAIVSRAPTSPPEWAKLDYQKCPNCPLSSMEFPHCPTAVQVADVVGTFAETYSYDTAEVHVWVSGREIIKKTSVQTSLSSLLGIFMTTSGCPVLAKLRPLVRFHSPFATEEETFFRSVALYLIAQYLRQQSGQTADWSLNGLSAIYQDIGTVNKAFAERLRVGGSKDANLNAVIRLDMFAKGMPQVIEDGLAELRPLFEIMMS
ncbi:MAG: DUF6901 family protein [Myxococcota bacterium]